MNEHDEPRLLRDKIKKIYEENDELIVELTEQNAELTRDVQKLKGRITALELELDTAKLRLAEKI